MFEQERTLSRLQQRILRESGLFACFLVGSFGRRDQDDFADLDVYLVYPTQQALEAAFAGRRELAGSILPYVAARIWENPGRPGQISVLFANGSKIDLFYAAREALAPAPHFSQIVILKDTNDWAADLSRQSAHAAPPAQAPASAADLEALDNRFWVALWDIWRRLQRGDVDTPFADYLELLRSVIPFLLAHLPERSPAADRLVDLEYTRDSDRSLDHLRRLIDGYTAARDAVAARYRLAYSGDAAFERALRQLIGR